MHEFTLTNLIVEEILQVNDLQPSSRIKKVNLGLGPFSHATFDRIKFWWEILTKDTIAEGSELIKNELPGKLFCPNCQTESIVKKSNSIEADEALKLFTCPNCQSLQTEIKSGTDITILDLEIVELA
jgi:hydrogenase nickel incorporation protein HypA/HybF